MSVGVGDVGDCAGGYCFAGTGSSSFKACHAAYFFALRSFDASLFFAVRSTRCCQRAAANDTVHMGGRPAHLLREAMRQRPFLIVACARPLVQHSLRVTRLESSYQLSACCCQCCPREGFDDDRAASGFVRSGVGVMSRALTHLVDDPGCRVESASLRECLTLPTTLAWCCLRDAWTDVRKDICASRVRGSRRKQIFPARRGWWVEDAHDGGYNG